MHVLTRLLRRMQSCVVFLFYLSFSINIVRHLILANLLANTVIFVYIQWITHRTVKWLFTYCCHYCLTEYTCIHISRWKEKDFIIRQFILFTFCYSFFFVSHSTIWFELKLQISSDNPNIVMWEMMVTNWIKKNRKNICHCQRFISVCLSISLKIQWIDEMSKQSGI